MIKKKIIEKWERMSQEQKADLARVTDGWMSREHYNKKWKTKSSSKHD